MDPITILTVGAGLIKGLKKIAPMLGPRGKKIAESVGIISDVIDDAKEGNLPPEVKTELEKAVMDHESDMAKIEAERLKTVNLTMQQEAQSEKWWQSAWRPFWGFAGGITFFGSYFFLPLMGKGVPEIPYEAWGVMAAILGVASWGRNKFKEKQIERAK